MKPQQDPTLLAQTIVCIIFAIGFFALLIYALINHNTTIIPYAFGALATIYAHWSQSPAQQSALTSLIQQLTPVLTSMTQQPTTSTTQPVKTVPVPSAQVPL